MSISATSATNPYIELTPQVQTARQGQLRQAIDVAVISKARAAGDAQAAAILNLLNSAAATADGLGTTIDYRV